MTYKDYTAEVEFDEEAGIFHGEVLNTRDVITIQGTSVKDLERAFKDSVEDYLAFCAGRGEQPDRPFSGKFVLRLSPEVHRRVFIASRRAKMSLGTQVARGRTDLSWVVAYAMGVKYLGKERRRGEAGEEKNKLPTWQRSGRRPN